MFLKWKIIPVFRCRKYDSCSLKMLSVEKSWSPLHVYHYQTYAIGLIVDENCRISSLKFYGTTLEIQNLKWNTFVLKQLHFTLHEFKMNVSSTYLQPRWYIQNIAFSCAITHPYFVCIISCHQVTTCIT